jgi:hypothetical protein
MGATQSNLFGIKLSYATLYDIASNIWVYNGGSFPHCHSYYDTTTTKKFGVIDQDSKDYTDKFRKSFHPALPTREVWNKYCDQLGKDAPQISKNFREFVKLAVKAGIVTGVDPKNCDFIDFTEIGVEQNLDCRICNVNPSAIVINIKPANK